MTTTNNFFENVANRSKALAAEGWDRAQSAFNGLRGQSAASVGNAAGRAVGGAAAATGETISEAGRGFSQGLRGEALPPDAANAKWGAQGSPEAQQFRAGGSSAPAPAQVGTPPKPGMLRTTAGKLGGAVGKLGVPGALAAGAIDSAGTSTEDYRQQWGLPNMTAVGRGLRGLGASENAAQLGDDLVVRGVGTAGSVANAATLGLFNKMVPPAEASTAPKPAGSTAAAPNPGLKSEAVQPTDDGSFVDLTNGSRARPNVLTDSNIGVPVPGQGAFRGGNRPAQAVGGPASMAAENARVQENAAAAQAKNSYTASLRAGGPSDGQGTSEGGGGVFGEMAKMASLRTADVSAQRNQAQMNKNVEHGLTNQGQQITEANNKAQIALQIHDRNHTLGNENEKRVETRTADYVRSKAEVANPQLYADPATRASEDAKLKQQTADVNERIKHTLSVTKAGITTGTLPDAQHSLLLKANDMRDRLEPFRNSKLAWAQDFFGDKRFDSKNLYSYLPARDKGGAVKAAEPGGFGYTITMGNGNKVKAYSVLNPNGGIGFNFTGPNDAIDADVMELIKPAIDAAQRK
jgi:hypothetical protein